MQYYALAGAERPALVARDEDDAFDLTSSNPKVETFSDLARAADITNQSVDDVARGLLDEADSFPADDLSERARRPVVPDEVWAAGVTYHISEQAREAESGMPDVYLDVYEGERPEIFFKATASRTVGPNEAVGIRGDSSWDVPEPELGVVLYRGDIVGYTVGNDVSSRSIEGENPLYLPQAKVYDRCCSIGPCITSAADIGDAQNLGMTMTIERDGEVLYEESASTAEMVKSCEELVSYYARHNTVPETAVLLTGTALVPSDDFTLQEGDDVRIEVDDIGVLENTVTVV
ncbi:fumarylacetoacetate hydrolase family protein [Halopelagius longus]|uniref:2-dehydro-3-deoxy-D-arabinonate dehydratase n=1 Tax=Halopelagius longus TaxID=1236180 RepID=A0A1H1FEJ9_9EURY|nr:fumarylacetoacetate hydrolase family protein [Halopelagius longus]RDI70142.1 fumarylacetoacetate hydrolase [Halopelagius longus]SDQ99280.1 2-dehydro-3-deoxy-D-arabinonate dehydratase [Halopelagius longus]